MIVTYSVDKYDDTLDYGRVQYYTQEWDTVVIRTSTAKFEFRGSMDDDGMISCRTPDIPRKFNNIIGERITDIEKISRHKWCITTDEDSYKITIDNTDEAAYTVIELSFESTFFK